MKIYKVIIVIIIIRIIRIIIIIIIIVLAIKNAFCLSLSLWGVGMLLISHFDSFKEMRLMFPNAQRMNRGGHVMDEVGLF